jgi:hypothetical protein
MPVFTSIRIGICVFALTCAGCTALSLERHTVNQAGSIADMRYQEVINQLAKTACNPEVLPSISLFSTGLSIVSDTWGFESATTIDRSIGGFAKQLFGLSLKHSPEQQWQLEPVVSQPQLAALAAAFRWAVYGAPEQGSPDSELLRSAEWMETGDYHFDVANNLSALPPRWLHVGHSCDVPKCALYQAHCGTTYVWVLPDGLSGLSDFTLIVMDISTVDISSLLFKSPKVTVERYIKGTQLTPPKGGAIPVDRTITERWPATQDRPIICPCRRVVGIASIEIQAPADEILPAINGIELKPEPSPTDHKFSQHIGNRNRVIAPAATPPPPAQSQFDQNILSAPR